MRFPVVNAFHVRRPRRGIDYGNGVIAATLDVICGAALGIAFAIAAWLLFINRWVGDGPPADDVKASRTGALAETNV